MKRVKYRQGDLIKNVTSGVIMHGCNSLGFMGAGIARQIKETYPENYETYADYCRNTKGDILGTVIFKKMPSGLIIANAITQRGVGGTKPVSYDAIHDCMASIWQFIESDKICMPMIGAGLGGGSWDVVEKIVEDQTPPDKEVEVWYLK